MNFTKLQFNILQGCLLGDGCIELNKNSKNACFKYRSSSKQHVEFVHHFFKEFCTENYSETKRLETYDKRVNKTYVSYYFTTKCLPIFTEEYKRWYKPKKIVPKDLEINGDVMLLWYIGDGELESNHGYIKFHTNSFTEEDVKLLCEKISFDSDYFRKGVDSNQFIIRVPRRHVRYFLKVIGDCPFDDYKHKWKQVLYKNKNIELHGIRDHSVKYPKIVKDWKEGNVTIYQLSKKYDIGIGSIKHHFRQNGINFTRVDLRKAILQIKDDFIIKEWTSGQEIRRELGFNASAVSECCRKIRKQYKGFKWIFKKDYNEQVSNQ